LTVGGKTHVASPKRTRSTKVRKPSTDVMMRTHAQPSLGPGQLPRVRQDDIALMFSGGVDSTATAIMLAEQHPRVHLLTYKNGYGHWYFHRVKNRFDELSKALDGSFQWTLVSIKEHFGKLLVNSVVDDYKQYKSGFIWFMGCKMAMHMRSIIYCLEHGVTRMADGSNEDTNEMVEQMLISLTLIRMFYNRYGVDFGTPVYEVRREDSRQLIKKWNLNMGIQVMDRHLCIQPTCVAGELYYMPYLLFNKKVKHDEAVVAEFINSKQEVAHKVMTAYFAAKGVDLDELVADRKAQIEAFKQHEKPVKSAPTQSASSF
jgi:predicted subunit of tRNA(5-methylaminomethyl-2-thiouridylate) methyltransferase